MPPPAQAARGRGARAAPAAGARLWLADQWARANKQIYVPPRSFNPATEIRLRLLAPDFNTYCLVCAKLVFFGGVRVIRFVFYPI